MLHKLKAWKHRFGSCYIPKNVFDAKELSIWVWQMRAARKKGHLSPDQMQQLEAVGFVWKPNVVGTDNTHHALKPTKFCQGVMHMTLACSPAHAGSSTGNHQHHHMDVQGIDAYIVNYYSRHIGMKPGVLVEHIYACLWALIPAAAASGSS
jgi:hypothetical protein